MNLNKSLLVGLSALIIGAGAVGCNAEQGNVSSKTKQSNVDSKTEQTNIGSKVKLSEFERMKDIEIVDDTSHTKTHHKTLMPEFFFDELKRSGVKREDSARVSKYYAKFAGEGNMYRSNTYGQMKDKVLYWYAVKPPFDPSDFTDLLPCYSWDDIVAIRREDLIGMALRLKDYTIAAADKITPHTGRHDPKTSVFRLKDLIRFSKRGLTVDEVKSYSGFISDSTPITYGTRELAGPIVPGDLGEELIFADSIGFPADKFVACKRILYRWEVERGELHRLPLKEILRLDSTKCPDSTKKWTPKRVMEYTSLPGFFTTTWREGYNYYSSLGDNLFTLDSLGIDSQKARRICGLNDYEKIDTCNGYVILYDYPLITLDIIMEYAQKGYSADEIFGKMKRELKRTDTLKETYDHRIIIPSPPPDYGRDLIM